jgi:hypothetical protein
LSGEVKSALPAFAAAASKLPSGGRGASSASWKTCSAGGFEVIRSWSGGVTTWAKPFAAATGNRV